MTNLEIAQTLLGEAKEGRLDPSMLSRLGESLRYGSHVEDPPAWLEGSADSLYRVSMISQEIRGQLHDIASRWDSITKAYSQ